MSLEKVMEDLVVAVETLTRAIKDAKGDTKATEAEPTRARGRPRKGDKEDDKLTPEKIKKAFGEYLGVEDQDEYDKRREFVESILNELGVDKVSDAPDKDQVRAYGWLQLKLDGKRVNFDDNGGGRGGRSLV